MNRNWIVLVAALLAALLLGSSSAFAAQDVCAGISKVPGRPLTTVLMASGLLRPTFVTAPPGDTERVFILEQDGRIRILRKGELLTFLDISAITRSPADGAGDEQGLLGLAFPPDYETTGNFFIYHTGTTGDNNVVRYKRIDPDTADPASRQVVLTLSHPTNTNHNGGMLAFGPDGDLYIGTGDGGGSCDSPGNAQNGTSPLGKLLRIDVRTLPYTIPPDNPFVGPGGFNDEIWAYGLRNPWRYSFDRGTQDLYIGDVGQGVWEEVDYRAHGSVGGENYGWDSYEGTVCPNPSCGSQGSCTLPSYVPPIFTYNQSGTPCAITGGYVYRGCRMPDLSGTYFYADYCAAFIRSFQVVGGLVTNPIDFTTELAPGGGFSIGLVTSFGEDARGEIYIVDRGATSPPTGEVYKIVPVLSNLEVSGDGGIPFVLSNSLWTWEDLQTTSSHVIAIYRVYRSPGRGNGSFTCIHQGSGTAWEGDSQVPDPGGIFSYIVTATNAAGVQSSPGTSSSGVRRKLSSAPCP